MMHVEKRPEMAPGLDLDLGSDDSGNSGDEVPVWVRGEQRWVSGVDGCTTCADLIVALLQDEASKGKPIGEPHQYHITERWRGVEQPLDSQAAILDIWSAWGAAQAEVRISLRKISSSEQMHGRRRRQRSESSCSWTSKHSSHTLHPRRLYALAADHRQLPPGGTEELLKLVLAQGEIIRKQLRRLRYSENQIGFLEDKTHRARVRKHGSNYLLETYLKGLPEAGESGASPSGDKNSDSGVMTEGDSGEPAPCTQDPYDRLSPAYSDGKGDEENSASEELATRQSDALDTISKLNKKLLKEEEMLVRLHISIKKYERNRDDFEQIQKSLSELRAEMAKSSCEMQHNEIVLEETGELLDARRLYLSSLQAELGHVDQEHEMLHALLHGAPAAPGPGAVTGAATGPTTGPTTGPITGPTCRRQLAPFTKELNTLV